MYICIYIHAISALGSVGLEALVPRWRMVSLGKSRSTMNLKVCMADIWSLQDSFANIYRTVTVLLYLCNC